MVAIQLDRETTILIGQKTIVSGQSVESDITCVTHGHLDHWGGRKKPSIMTNETYNILRARKIGISNYLSAKHGETINPFGDIKITLMNSGHMLGSSLFKIETPELDVVYTGDLNTVETMLDRPAKVVNGEELIIEATYGAPLYKFGPRENIYAQIVRWILKTIKEGFIPCFKVYSAGKAQEIIALVNRLLDIDVVVSQNVYRVSSVYKMTYPWMNFELIGSIESGEILRNGEFVYVSSSRSYVPTWKKTKWAVATGWALTSLFPEFDAAFPLSSHADFKGLLDYVEAVSPRKIFTLFGHSVTFAKFLRKLGYSAYALEEKPRVEI